MNTLKPAFYDEFRCIADRCSFSCCKGWEITVDPETYSKWKSDTENFEYFSRNIKGNGRKGSSCSIKMGPQKSCPFLDEKGLCKIVINNGDDYLPDTCRTFPRQVNSLDNSEEYSLSCACPAVVDIINSINGNIDFFYDGANDTRESIPVRNSLRETMITVMQNTDFLLKDKLLFLFHMLLSFNNGQTVTKELVRKYRDDNYLKELINLWSGVKVSAEDSLPETNELFLDIVYHYKNEKNYKEYLKDISELANQPDMEKDIVKWKLFERIFVPYEKLLVNCIVTKLFANCTGKEIDELIMSFQMLVTEYVMVRYSAFLKWSRSETNEIAYSDIRDYIVIYSRIIGYNADGMREFWEDSFDEAVWEFGYLLLLIN